MFKTVTTCIISLSILLSFVVYLYNLSDHVVNIQHYRAWYNIELVGSFFLLRLIEKRWADTFLQESIVGASFLFLYILGIDVGLTQLGFVKDPYSTLIVFILGSLLSLTFLVVELIRCHERYN